MWQAPNQQRINAVQGTKKKAAKRLSMHIMRVRACVRLAPSRETHAKAVTPDPEGRQIEARVLLNDLSPKGIGIYSQKPMEIGQEIKITLEEPKRIEISGNVVWCQEQSGGSTAVLSSQTFKYRAGVKFNFSSPEEEQSLKTFCEDLEKNHLFRPKP